MACGRKEAAPSSPPVVRALGLYRQAGGQTSSVDAGEDRRGDSQGCIAWGICRAGCGSKLVASGEEEKVGSSVPA